MALRTFLRSLASPWDRCQVFGGGAFPFTTNLLPPIFGLGRGPGRSGTGPAMTGAFPKAARFFACRSRCSCCDKVEAMFATFAVWPKKPSHSATVGAVGAVIGDDGGGPGITGTGMGQGCITAGGCIIGPGGGCIIGGMNGNGGMCIGGTGAAFGCGADNCWKRLGPGAGVGFPGGGPAGGGRCWISGEGGGLFPGNGGRASVFGCAGRVGSCPSHLSHHPLSPSMRHHDPSHHCHASLLGAMFSEKRKKQVVSFQQFLMMANKNIIMIGHARLRLITIHSLRTRPLICRSMCFLKHKFTRFMMGNKPFFLHPSLFLFGFSYWPGMMSFPEQCWLEA